MQDRASIAVLNRNLTVPSFTHSESGGLLTITTSEVALTYKVGSGGFAPETLYATPMDKSSTFPGWRYGDAEAGNLLGTIRGLDGQGQTPLNCSVNNGVLDNGEYNHCEW